MNFLSRKISKEQSKDAGLAVTLIFLILGFFTGEDLYFKLAVAALLTAMTVPKIYKPFAHFWFGFAEILGTVVSKILLSVVFILIVLPVALARKLMGKDSLNLKSFGKDLPTAFTEKYKIYTKEDLEKPF